MATKNQATTAKKNTESVKSTTAKAQPTAAEVAAKAARKHDADITSKTNKATLIAKHSLASTAAWCREFKNGLKSVDPALAKAADTEWNSVYFEFRLQLNNVIVEEKCKVDGKVTTRRVVKNVMWVKKTDKVGIPTYFEKASVESFRINDKQGKGEQVSVKSASELAVTRLVKSPVKVLVTDAEGNQYLANKMAPDADGVMKPVYEDKEVVFVPVEQLDFDFAEVKHAFSAAMLKVFGSKSAKYNK